jgi:serine/threonine-protein kinase
MTEIPQVENGARGRLKPPPRGALLGGVYRIEGTLGSGSAGVVLRAIDERLNRWVAIKWIRPDTYVECTPEQFLIDARDLARVSHANVVSIYAFGVHEGLPYLVMEYVPGRTLRQWIDQRRGPAPFAEAMAMIGQICGGVGAIHQAGAIHGDLKPNNVLVSPEGRLAVADLGLSRVWEDGPSGMPISVAGTPGYMAPEKLGSRPRLPALMSRADIYSVGVMAYELLTGTLPFQDEHAGNVMRQQLYRAPDPPSSRRSGLSHLYDRPILRALAKSPRDRYPSIGGFWSALSEAHEEARQHPAAGRVLLVDDDEDFRDLAALCLRQAFTSAEIVHCSDGESGLSALERDSFELAVVDLHLPRMNGMELTAAIRALPSGRDLPILVVTGRGGAADWRVLSKLGASGFFVKPLEPAAFVQTATRLVAQAER